MTLKSVVDRLNACKGNWRLISKRSGVPYSSLCKIAQGVNKNPGALTVEALAAELRDEARAA